MRSFLQILLESCFIFVSNTTAKTISSLHPLSAVMRQKRLNWYFVYIHHFADVRTSLSVHAATVHVHLIFSFFSQGMLTVPVRTDALGSYVTAPESKLLGWWDAPPFAHAYLAACWLSMLKLVSTCTADAARSSASSAWSPKKAVAGNVEDSTQPAM